MKSKLILTAAVLSTMAGGVISYADEGPTTWNEDHVYEASGAGESLTFDAQQESNAILLGAGKDTDIIITGYENLNFINKDSEKTGHEGIIANGDNSSITINNVKNINLGASREDLLNVSNHSKDHNGVAIHGFQGAVNIGIGNGEQATVDTLNIYSANVGILAQQSAGTSGSIYIHVNDAVNVYADDSNAIQAGIFATVDNGHTSLKIKSEGTITAVSNGYAAVNMNDKYGGSSNDGHSELELIANGDVTLEGIGKGTSSGAYGINAGRGAGTSDLTVTSLNGNVNITGDLGAVRLSSANTSDGERVSGLITGNEIKLVSTGVNVANDDSATVQVGYSKLDIQGDKITIDAADENAINVKGNTGELTFGDGTTKTDIYVNGYMTVTDGATATFAENTTTHVDSKYLTNEEKAFITTGGGENKGSVILDGNLDVGKIATGTTLNFSDDKELNKTAAESIITNNVLQNITVSNDGTMSVGTVSSEKAHKVLAGSLLTDVALYATENNMDGVTTLLTGENDVEALNSAAGLSAMAGVEHGTYTAAGIFNDAVADHLMNRNDEDVWAYGFHNKENVNGLSFGADYDAQYNGVVAGADLYRNGGTVAGIALSYADGNVSGSNGFVSTQNDADYYGASLYARFDRGSYALLGDISYMKGDHDVTQWNKGQQITASPDSDAVSVGVKAVKDFTAGESGTLTPYIGVRYLRLSTDGFTASNGLHYEGDDQDLVLIPVGVNYSAAITGGSWTFRPYAGVGYIWNAGDKSVDQTVTLGTAADSFSYDTVDSGSFLTRVGFVADHGDMSYGVGYSYQKGDSVSNNAWTLSASFRF